MRGKATPQVIPPTLQHHTLTPDWQRMTRAQVIPSNRWVLGGHWHRQMHTPFVDRQHTHQRGVSLDINPQNIMGGKQPGRVRSGIHKRDAGWGGHYGLTGHNRLRSDHLPWVATGGWLWCE
eukprot:3940850-Rhodomonas_salina.1